jgi:coenzyme F420-reducing hydrogenase gamma subunit
MSRKIRLGWFSFSCCEDNTVLFAEILNDHFFLVQEKFDIIHAKVLQNVNKWEGMDVAFVEGAVADKEQEETLKKIRRLSKTLVAIGSCACTGMPSAHRNSFDENTIHEIRFLKDRFSLLDKVHPLKDIVKVDMEVPGCPMDEGKFLEALTAVIKMYGDK